MIFTTREASVVVGPRRRCLYNNHWDGRCQSHSHQCPDTPSCQISHWLNRHAHGVQYPLVTLHLPQPARNSLAVEAGRKIRVCKKDSRFQAAVLTRPEVEGTSLVTSESSQGCACAPPCSAVLLLMSNHSREAQTSPQENGAKWHRSFF